MNVLPAKLKKTWANDIRERFGFAFKARREQFELSPKSRSRSRASSPPTPTYLSEVERGSPEQLAIALNMSLSEFFASV